jgi:hypothetical protein
VGGGAAAAAPNRARRLFDRVQPQAAGPATAETADLDGAQPSAAVTAARRTANSSARGGRGGLATRSPDLVRAVFLLPRGDSAPAPAAAASPPAPGDQ